MASFEHLVEVSWINADANVSVFLLCRNHLWKSTPQARIQMRSLRFWPSFMARGNSRVNPQLLDHREVTKVTKINLCTRIVLFRARHRMCCYSFTIILLPLFPIVLPFYLFSSHYFFFFFFHFLFPDLRTLICALFFIGDSFCIVAHRE